MAHLERYYVEHPDIPIGRRPNIIHVVGSYTIIKADSNSVMMDANTGHKTPLAPNSFFCAFEQPDIQAIGWTLDGLQQRASASTHILFSYSHLLAAVIRT